MPISRGQMPRQMYGLGSLVKSIGKTVKKIVKSPVAKVAMLGFGANALMPGGLSSLFSGGGGLTGILGKGKSILDGLTGAQKITGALALGGAFAGMEDQQVEELRQNPEALRGYLAQYYRNLNQGASDEEVNRFVEANMTEYKADGGRIGYREGELAYDATNTNIYGSSAASFTPKTIMNQSGDQVQAGFGKTPGRPEMQPGNPFMGKPAIPDISNRPATLPNQPFGQPLFDKDGFRLGDQRYGTGLVGGPSMALPGSGLTNQTPLAGSGGISEIDMPIAGGNNNAGGILPVESQLPGFRDEKAEYYTGKNYGPGNQGYAAVMPQEGMTFVYDQNGRRYSVPIEGYEGPTSLSSALQQPMPFAQQANSSSPIAQVAQMANGGRMGYQDGTGDPTYTGNNMEDLPRGLQMDTTTSNPIPEESSFMENLTLLNEIKGGVSPSTKIYLLKEFMDKALERGEITEERYNEMLMPFFGETGEGITSQIENFERENFAMGSPEENAVQASGIMDLPLNQNPAGITELDLRETGGFIPPVGVKEKADDIPAMLSNNEFVFTADAVRGMGEGNVNKGAQRMYDMMKKLEKGGRV